MSSLAMDPVDREKIIEQSVERIRPQYDALSDAQKKEFRENAGRMIDMMHASEAEWRRTTINDVLRIIDVMGNYPELKKAIEKFRDLE